MTGKAIDIWREKVEFLEGELAATDDAGKKFAIGHQLNEAKAKISELSSGPDRSEAGSPEGRDAPSEKIKILFLAASPVDMVRLHIDKEMREVDLEIRSSDYRDNLELVAQWAVQPDDLLRTLNRHRPHVVHFSGHGEKSEELLLTGSDGRKKPVSKPALESLFRTLKDNIRLVVLNACYSKPQAEAIVRHIDCAVGMSRQIADETAVIFASSFYRAIGFGRSVQEAFDQGKTALLLEGAPGDDAVELVVRDGADASEIYLINPDSTNQARSGAIPTSGSDDASRGRETTRDQVFISYAHEDRKWLERILRMLSPFVRQGAIVPWDDTKIPPGARWEDEIDTALARARVAVLLVSPDFFASDFIMNKELPVLQKAAERGELTLLWIPLRHSLYDATDLVNYQAVGNPKRPLAGLNKPDQEEMLLAICRQIKNAVEN